jgi:hypothetical protein
MRHRRFALPAILIAIGVAMLLGCIPVPATQQFTTTGAVKPTYKIGKSGKYPIQLGHTNIKQAIAFLDQHLSGTEDNQIFNGPGDKTAVDVHASWQKVGLNTYAVPFSVRTWVLIWPLCATMTSGSSWHYLLLKTDENGTVVDFEVISHDDFNKKLQPNAKPLDWPLEQEIHITPAKK